MEKYCMDCSNCTRNCVYDLECIITGKKVNGFSLACNKYTEEQI